MQFGSKKGHMGSLKGEDDSGLQLKVCSLLSASPLMLSPPDAHRPQHHPTTPQLFLANPRDMPCFRVLAASILAGPVSQSCVNKRPFHTPTKWKQPPSCALLMLICANRETLFGSRGIFFSFFFLFFFCFSVGAGPFVPSA